MPTWLTNSPTNHRPANVWKCWNHFFNIEEKLLCCNCNLRLNWYQKSTKKIDYRDLRITFQWSLLLYLEICGVSDDRTVNTSTTTHISDQLETANACKTLLCWTIVMTWVLVCNDMCQYEHHFGFFLPQSRYFRDSFDCPYMDQHREDF